MSFNFCFIAFYVTPRFIWCVQLYTNTGLVLFQPIPVEKRTAVALWRLGTGCGYRTLKELFGIGISTACKIFLEFVTAIKVALGPQYLVRPSGYEFLRIVQHVRISSMWLGDRWDTHSNHCSQGEKKWQLQQERLVFDGVASGVWSSLTILWLWMWMARQGPWRSRVAKF